MLEIINMPEVKFSIIASLILSIWAFLSTRFLHLIPGRYQILLELIYESFFNLLKGILKKETEKFFPFLFTLFMYILIMNLFDLIPGMWAPTQSLSVNAGLAIVIFIIAHVYGIRKKGFKKYILHLGGNPRTLGEWLMFPYMLLLHLVTELIKPVSLSLRLFANIFADDFLFILTVGAFSFILPVPLMAFMVLTGIVQAFVFTLLSAIYISMVANGEE